MIQIQTNPILDKQIYDLIRSKNRNVGASVNFVGYVRDIYDDKSKNLKHLIIEHYQGMTDKSLHVIESFAIQNWDLEEVIIIHRVGLINLSEPIVFIVVFSKHRDNAFDACRYIIDQLKIKAPFWKKEVYSNDSCWVEQKDSDLAKAK